jgi:DNA-binding NtrC family response regulator
MKFFEHMHEQGQRYLRDVLRASDGNRAAAARRAGINRTHFYRLLHRFDVYAKKERKPIERRSSSRRARLPHAGRKWES